MEDHLHTAWARLGQGLPHFCPHFSAQDSVLWDTYLLIFLPPFPPRDPKPTGLRTNLNVRNSGMNKMASLFLLEAGT